MQQFMQRLLLDRNGRDGPHGRFNVGDHVAWNPEARRVSGTIIKFHTRDVEYKGYVDHARKDNPQYEIKSTRTDHVAMHKGAALRKTGG